jgi:outer membrane protein TolC
MASLLGGCASSRYPQSRYAATLRSQSVESGDETIAHDELSETSLLRPGGMIQPVGFDDQVFVASPVAVASLGADDPQNGDAAIVATFASANDLPPAPADAKQSVEYFVALALAGHPSIQAARQRVSAEINRIPQARALPDPILNNTFWPIHEQSLQTAAGRIGNQMSLSQSVPWPKKLRTKAAIVSQEVHIAQAEVDRISREIAESVHLAYYEVWFATRAIEINEETRLLIDDLERVAEARYRSGGTQQDVLRARLESDRLDDQLIGLIKQKQVAQADLAALVQQPVTLLAEASKDLPLSDVPAQLDDLIELAEKCNPKLAGLAWEIQRDRQKQRLACLQKYPDLQVGVHWGLVSDDQKALSALANGHDTISFNVGTTLPIWRDKIHAGVREAAHRTSSTTRRLDAERDALYGKLRRLLAQADAFTEQRDIYEKRIIPRTEDILRLSIADYRGKRTDFFSLIETQRELLMFEMQLARINASLAGSVAQIERAVGCE